MSYFAFEKDKDGNILASDQKVLEAIELLIQNFQRLNEYFEEAFETKLTLQDIENGPDSR